MLIADCLRDPIAVLEAAGGDALPELVPIRHGRMAESPFAFFRGARRVMALDLATHPSRLRVQACGDAHVANFGTFATPERNVVFDINDFDETVPGPWEWDVKRLAASLHVVGRGHGFAPAVPRDRHQRSGVSGGLAQFAAMRDARALVRPNRRRRRDRPLPARYRAASCSANVQQGPEAEPFGRSPS